jgi:hypothetical protein
LFGIVSLLLALLGADLSQAGRRFVASSIPVFFEWTLPEMAYADAPRLDAPLIRSQASGSYWFIANGEALGLANTRSDYNKIGPTVVLKLGPSDYRAWFEESALMPTFGGPTSYVGQIGAFDADTPGGYATATDGATWTARDTVPDANVPDRVIHPNCSPGSPSTDWMRGEASPGCVIWDPTAGLFKCWGHGGNNTGPRAIFYATSSDGIAWTFGNSGAPVLQAGATGAWDDGRVADARVIQISATSYVMLYRGTPASGMPQIGRATSSDGISWTKTGTTPVVASGTGWDAFAVYTGGLLYDAPSGQMHLWYGGDNAGDTGGQALGYAWSDDLGATWTKSPLNPVLGLSAAGLDSATVGDTIFAYVDGATAKIQYGAEKPTPNGLTGYFRGRLEATVPFAPLAPTLVGAGASSFTATTGATLSPGLPTGWQPNDIHVLVAHRSDNTAMTALAGWTQLFAQNNTTGQRVEVWWRRAVTGDAAPAVTFGTSTIVRGAVIFGVRGCPRDVSPFNLTSISANAASATVSTSNISPATAPTLGVFVYAYEDDPTAAATPAGPTDQQDWQPFSIATSALGTDMALGVSSRKWGQAGSYGTPSTTVSGGTFANSPNVGLLFAFDPLPVSPFPPFPRRVITLRR